MADIFTKRKRSEIMSRIRNKDSKIEIEFRKALWKEGFRYRKNVNGYFGKPDLVLKKYKTVIFIDSCFWHGCKKHCKLPATNNKFWKEKIEKNMQRDKKVTLYYKRNNWKIIRIWEHDLKDIEVSKIIDKIKI
jgi:DNA mismatch endonuclease (patch repair protein)